MVGQLERDVDEFPFAVGNFVFYAIVSPIERYALLGISIEGGAMKYPPGKRLEYEWRRDVAQNPLATVFQDYDWADEVLHTQIARKWIGVQLQGDMARARKIAAETNAQLQKFRQEQEAKERVAGSRAVVTAAIPAAERRFAE